VRERETGTWYLFQMFLMHKNGEMCIINN
jgi:hypothetical protein